MFWLFWLFWLVIGVLIIVVVFGGLLFGFFKLQNKLVKGGIRIDCDVELEGVDLFEMGVLGYFEFMGVVVNSYLSDDVDYALVVKVGLGIKV